MALPSKHRGRGPEYPKGSGARKPIPSGLVGTGNRKTTGTSKPKRRKMK